MHLAGHGLGYGNFGFRSLVGLLALNNGDLSALCPQIGKPYKHLTDPFIRDSESDSI